MTRRASGYNTLLFMLVVLAGVSLIRGWWAVALMALPIFLLTLHSSRLQLARLESERCHTREIDALHLRTIETLAEAIDAKDSCTHRHLQRVVRYAEAIGQELGLAEVELKALRAAALLHDVGKLAIPAYIISKPGRLTAEEFEKMKTHPVVGAQILERARFPYAVVPIVRSHHEHWDGSGYPDGLAGEEIPIGARILAVVDGFDALASDRQYRRALSPEQALAAVRRDAGALYDPKIVELLEKVYPKVEALIGASPRPDNPLPAIPKVHKGEAPRAGLSVEKVEDTSSALYSIMQARAELQVLYELTQALGNSLSVDETLRLLAEQLHKLIPFDAIAVFLIRDGNLVPRFVEGVNASMLAHMQIPLGEGLSGWVAAHGSPSLNGNPAVEPGYLEDPEEFSKLLSALSVPLDSTRGVIGALTLYSTRLDGFAIDHLRILKTVGIKAGCTIHNALIHEAIGQSAETDALTGLPNARALSKRLEQESARAIRERTPFSVFVADLDGLQRINDTFGHLTGNRVLKAVAGALRGCLREYDLVARTGGDEFVILLPGMDARNAAAKRTEMAGVVEALNGEFRDAQISASIGFASFPADSHNPAELMALADRRMYRDKRDFRLALASSSATA